MKKLDFFFALIFDRILTSVRTQAFSNVLGLGTPYEGEKFHKSTAVSNVIYFLTPKCHVIIIIGLV